MKPHKIDPSNLDFEMRYSVPNFCSRAVKRLRFEGADALELKCYNKQEANEVSKHMDKNYPDIRYRVTWLEWSE